ncbi:hypothetical protein [Anatilimnocola aggregata]|nr:hypothetical protein [Anatilimnocola aggregata]
MKKWLDELAYLWPTHSGASQKSLRQPYGTIAVADDGSELAQEARVSYLWRPTTELGEELDERFSVLHRARVMPSGGRMIRPADPEIFAGQASAVGQLILRRELSDYLVSELNALPIQLIRCRAASTHACISRRFACHSDLHVKQRGADLIGAGSVLPLDLGLDARGTGRPWTVEILLKEGRARAKADGHSNCPTATVISFGLMAAAERNPLVISAAESESLVRAALFEVVPPPADWEDRLLNVVTERYVAAVERRSAMPQAKFDASMSGGKSNLPKTLMGKPGTKGGVLSKAVVQYALQELTWLSYYLSAIAIDWYATAFVHALESPLENEDLVRFSQLHRSQPYFGYLPLALVWRRQELLRPIITRIWREPSNESLWHVLWRMLYFFSSMVENRRMADRAFKGLGLADLAMREEMIRPRQKKHRRSR